MDQKKNSLKGKNISHHREQGTWFPIVGIGTSSGGLGALEVFFSKMPPDSGMAFVIIQHPTPDQKSSMSTILKKYTAMKILEAAEGMKIDVNCVYFNPPGKDMVIKNRIFSLRGPVKKKDVTLSINCFFRSLSEEEGDKSICIILSGNTIDATSGLKAVKDAGGIVIVQEEDEAGNSMMPKRAINTGCADYIVPVEKMPDELINYVAHSYIAEDPLTVKTDREDIEDGLRKIITEIHSKTGHDYSDYKKNTLLRRIERRMAICKINKIEDYVEYLYQSPAEVNILFEDFLLGVTNFFRDKEAFEVLRVKVLPDLLKKRRIGSPVRIWVPGCGTGEEAYSIAMLLKEIMKHYKKKPKIQIFATDLNAKSIQHARLALYPASIAADVSPERLTRFFIRDGNTYRAKKEIREMILFAVQCVIHHPPFSRLDMISCRNLLMYLDPDLQKKLLTLFKFALVDNGLLFLGSSESLGACDSFFSPVDKRWRIFKLKEKNIAETIYCHSLPVFYGPYSHLKNDGKTLSNKEVVYRLAEKMVLDNYSPPSVLINDKFEILYFMGHTHKYLTPPTGEASLNIMKMVRGGLQYRLGAIFRKALKEKKSIVCENMHIEQKSGTRIVDLIVKPLMDQNVQHGLMLVVFNEKTSSDPAALKNKKISESRESEAYIKSLEQELHYTKDHLERTIEELETSNEDLMMTNEELQSANEEIRSSNEELETSREELQSTNEELRVVNCELEEKIEELCRANNDMNNLLASTEIGTIFLDEKLCIKRYTPCIAHIFHLRDSDIGRPLDEITSTIKYDYLKQDAQEVLKTLTHKEMELESAEGIRYSMRILPYRTQENFIKGIVITFVDITALKHAEKALIAEKNRAQKYLDVAGAILVVIDADQKVSLINQKGAEVLGFDEKEIIGKNWFDNFIPERFRDEVKVVFNKLMTAEIEPVEYYENPVLTKDGRERMIAWHNIILKDSSGNIMCTLSSGEDITERKQAEDDKNRAYCELNQIFSASVPLCVIDKNFTMLKINDSFSSFFRMERDKVIGRKCHDIWQGPLCDAAECPMKQILGGKDIYEYDVDKELGDGTMISCIVTARPFKSVDGEIIGVVENFTDITERKNLEHTLKCSLKEKEVLFKEVHHRVKNNLQIINSLLSLQCSSLKDKNMIEVFKLAQNRVNSMALVHEQLYQSEDLSRINFIEYMQRLIAHLRRSYQGIIGNIAIKIDKTENILLQINTAISCGLIINELVINSFKYAFSQGENGEIGISINRDEGRFVLIVKDNGIGLSKEIDINNVSSLGLQLVTSLARQLRGSIEIDRERGTCFTITFPEQD
ncbi:MAG: CheR family methyltransferase [bacterium]